MKIAVVLVVAGTWSAPLPAQQWSRVASPLSPLVERRAADATPAFAPPMMARTPCPVHRGVTVLAGAVGGALAGWFTFRVVAAGGDGSRGLERALIAGGAIVGIVLAWTDDAPPLMPPRCHRENLASSTGHS